MPVVRNYPDRVRGTICSVKDETRVSCMQGKSRSPVLCLQPKFQIINNRNIYRKGLAGDSAHLGQKEMFSSLLLYYLRAVSMGDVYSFYVSVCLHCIFKSSSRWGAIFPYF